MGQAVARTFAGSGVRTLAKSSRAAALRDHAKGVEVVDRLPPVAPDLIIEFVPETVAAKQAVYGVIEATYPNAEFILATGTSGLDLVELAASLERPERFLGLHYFMPADQTPIVEVMAGPAISKLSVDVIADALRQTGKDPIVLYHPIVGFLINRLQHAILHEAYYLIEAGVASASDIDRAARRMLAPRMCLNGLIQQKDISGLRIHAAAQRSVVPALFHNGLPNSMLQRMVDRGETGLMCGMGFYDWSRCDPEAVLTDASTRLAKLLEFLSVGCGQPAPNTTPAPRALGAVADT